MIWLFENDTSSIVNKLAKRSLKSEKRRNLMVVIAVALAAFLVCFTGIISVSLVQIQRNQEVDTYEAVFTGVTESDVKKLKGISEFARVGEYYLLGREHDRQGYHASYVYCDSEMMYIARSQMELIKGRLPKQADEVAVKYHRRDVLCIFYSTDGLASGASAFSGSLCGSKQKILWRRSCPVPVPISGNGAVRFGIVWHGTSPVCLDGPQAEKAIPDRADADAGVGCI